MKRLLAAVATAALAALTLGAPATPVHAANTPGDCNGQPRQGDSLESYGRDRYGNSIDYYMYVFSIATPHTGAPGCDIQFYVYVDVNDFNPGSSSAGWICSKTYRTDVPGGWQAEQCQGESFPYPASYGTQAFRWNPAPNWTTYVPAPVGYGGCTSQDLILQIDGGPQFHPPLNLCAW